METDFSSFREKVLKIHDKRFNKIKDSVQTRTAYRWLVKNKYLNKQDISETDFRTIIKEVNNSIIDEFLKGYDIKFPHGMGGLQLRKMPAKIKFINNRMVTNKPINWKETLLLWNTDKEAYDSKLVVRNDIKEIFSIQYIKNRAFFKNAFFYNFRPARNIKKKLFDKINNNEIDAFLKYEVH